MKRAIRLLHARCNDLSKFHVTKITAAFGGRSKYKHMKKYVFAFLFLYSYTGIKAQLYVQSGATLHVGGVVTLQNEDLIRSSPSGPAIVFEPDSKVLFTGNADNTISGYIDFLNLEIDKEGSHQVSLQNYNEAVRGQMTFTSGFFNLNNNTLMLGNTGTLVNENENSRIIGPGGGAVQARLTLNQPTGVNPGNIGAAITSTKNLGDVVINRSYVDAYSVPSNSVKRYYSINFIEPANDADLNAVLRLYYFDAELDGADETKLAHWKREDFSDNWVQQGPPENITRNTDENWVQLTAIGSLSTWTLAEASGALPVEFAFFNVACESNAAVISWQTATEINTHHFEVQRSVNGADWLAVATQKAAGQSSTLQQYSYTDPAPASSGKIFYRISSVDINGRKSYTAVKASACGTGALWQVWPNPVQQQANISLKLDGAYKVSVQLLDNKGSVVRQWQKELVHGDNRFTVDMQGLAAGVYHLVVTWDEGRSRKSERILKQ